MAQMPLRSSVPISRLLVSPTGAVAYMVAVGSGLWSSPMEWPASWVTVFSMSMLTQPV